MAKSSKGKGSDYGAGSAKSTGRAPQPTKRARYAPTQVNTRRAAGRRG